MKLAIVFIAGVTGRLIVGYNSSVKPDLPL